MPMVLSSRARRFLDMSTMAKAFQAAIPGIEQAAAQEATQVSRARFDNLRGFPYGRRPFAPSRPGRLSTEGVFSSRIEWVPDGKGSVTIDETVLPWYWIIQEIGTGKEGESLNPVRAWSVESQIGRKISAKLLWSTAAGGQADGPSSELRATQQLFQATDLDQKSVAAIKPIRGTIRKEIHGKHFIQAGGRWGVFQLERALVDEAVRTFR